MIGIINYGMGNLTSVKNAIDFLQIPNKILNSAKELKEVEKAILPGVGAFGLAMENIQKMGLDEAISQFTISQKKPLLGLCLGMQLLFESSQEHGFYNGLGLVKGSVKSLKDVVIDQPVPHMGWNDLISTETSQLLNNIPKEEQIFYFVHSFYCMAENESVVTAKVKYELEFDVVIEQGNIFGCQFHPEKSQQSGLKLLSNFCNL
jgi:glutamine amidotransferase